MTLKIHFIFLFLNEFRIEVNTDCNQTKRTLFAQVRGPRLLLPPRDRLRANGVQGRHRVRRRDGHAGRTDLCEK